MANLIMGVIGDEYTGAPDYIVSGKTTGFIPPEDFWIKQQWELLDVGDYLELKIFKKDTDGNWKEKWTSTSGTNEDEGWGRRFVVTIHTGHPMWILGGEFKAEFRHINTAGGTEIGGEIFFEIAGVPIEEIEEEPQEAVHVGTITEGTDITRSYITITARNGQEASMIREFLGVSPVAPPLDVFLATRTPAELEAWQSKWRSKFQTVSRTDLITYVQNKFEEYSEEDDGGGEEDIIEDAPEEEDEFGADPGIRSIIDIIKEGEYAESLNEDEQKMFAQMVGIFGGGAVAGLGASAIAGIIGTIQTLGAGIVGVSAAAKGASAVMGVDTLMVWLAQDNVLTGLGFTVRKLREAFKAGVRTSEEVYDEIEQIKKWQDAAESVVRISTELNPLLIPFKEILLANVDKAKKDLELEIAIIDDIAQSL